MSVVVVNEAEDEGRASEGWMDGKEEDGLMEDLREALGNHQGLVYNTYLLLLAHEGVQHEFTHITYQISQCHYRHAFRMEILSDKGSMVQSNTVTCTAYRVYSLH